MCRFRIEALLKELRWKLKFYGKLGEKESKMKTRTSNDFNPSGINYSSTTLSLESPKGLDHTITIHSPVSYRRSQISNRGTSDNPQSLVCSVFSICSQLFFLEWNLATEIAILHTWPMQHGTCLPRWRGSEHASRTVSRRSS